MVIMKFQDNDPLKYLHVPRRKRLSEDKGSDSDALDDKTGDDGNFDRDEIRTRGEVVSKEDLT